MVISLGTRDAWTGHVVAFVTALDFRPRRATVFVGRFGDCCREDCPFHSARQSPPALVTVALATAEDLAPIWTVDAVARRLPGFHRAPRSVQLGLSSDPQGQRPSFSSTLASARSRSLVKVQPAPTARASLVPKGRLELPRPYGHYALNVARLPFRHFGLEPTIGVTDDLRITRPLLYQ